MELIRLSYANFSPLKKAFTGLVAKDGEDDIQLFQICQIALPTYSTSVNLGKLDRKLHL